MRFIKSLLTPFIFFLCACGNTNKPEKDFFPKTDTTHHTLCVYQVNDTGYQVGYLTRTVKDTLMLAKDTVTFTKDSSEFSMTGKKKWIKDTAYFIDLSVMDTALHKIVIKPFPLNFSAVIADAGKDVEKILTLRKLKLYVEKPPTKK